MAFGVKSWPHWHQGRSALRKACHVAPYASSADTATLPFCTKPLSWSKSIILSGRWKQSFTNVGCKFPDVRDNIANLPLPRTSYQRICNASPCTISLPASTIYTAVCRFSVSPRAKMSIRESDQTPKVHKTLQLCEVRWSSNTKKRNRAVSRWGVWCLCNPHTGSQITERKSLWADIQNLFINTGWMTNLWPDIFSVLQSIYCII